MPFMNLTFSQLYCTKLFSLIQFDTCHYMAVLVCMFKSQFYRVAMVLGDPGKSWNWKKKLPGHEKSLNLGCGP